MDPSVKDLAVTTGVRFFANGDVKPTVKYTYYVGTHGPFTEVYLQGQDTPVQVQADIQQRVNNLRQLGVAY
jgi:hypothetical protein